MTKYNKAQEKCIKQWAEYPCTIKYEKHIREFLEEFNEIDSVPDRFNVVDAKGVVKFFYTEKEAQDYLINKYKSIIIDYCSEVQYDTNRLYWRTLTGNDFEYRIES